MENLDWVKIAYKKFKANLYFDKTQLPLRDRVVLFEQENIEEKLGELCRALMSGADWELYEETGALEFELWPVCVYSVTAADNFDGQETFGMLYFAEVKRFEGELHSEIEKIIITKEMPKAWTYPEIQPKLLEEAGKRGFLK